jgi:serine/threonine protein kinase
MPDDRWKRVESLFHAARDEVVSLLASAGPSFVDRGVEGIVARNPLTGSRLGPYSVGPLLGAGGMGAVYRARDTKLDRDVALKVLPAAFALDADRLARFKREARVLASLNHPNIAAIYGFEDSGATHALILELVEGPTLADRVARGPLPIEESLAIAAQIADGLDAAHGQGIIHRDLKPANVKVRDDGTVKVLDFGLAKAVSSESGSPDLTATPTVTADVTRTGTLLGTAAYMSPEQAWTSRRQAHRHLGVRMCAVRAPDRAPRLWRGRHYRVHRERDDEGAGLDGAAFIDASTGAPVAEALSEQGSAGTPARHRRCANRARGPRTRSVQRRRCPESSASAHELMDRGAAYVRGGGPRWRGRLVLPAAPR